MTMLDTILKTTNPANIKRGKRSVIPTELVEAMEKAGIAKVEQNGRGTDIVVTHKGRIQVVFDGVTRECQLDNRVGQEGVNAEKTGRSSVIDYCQALLTCSQTLSALKELFLYQSADVVKTQDGYRFSFDWCGDRITALFDGTGKLVKCVDQHGLRRKIHDSIVDGALALAVRVTCLDNDLEDDEVANG